MHKMPFVRGILEPGWLLRCYRESANKMNEFERHSVSINVSIIESEYNKYRVSMKSGYQGFELNAYTKENTTCYRSD